MIKKTTFQWVLFFVLLIALPLSGADHWSSVQQLLRNSGLDSGAVTDALGRLRRWAAALPASPDKVLETVLQSEVYEKQVQFLRRQSGRTDTFPVALPVMLRFLRSDPGRMIKAYAGLDDRFRLHVSFSINPVRSAEDHGVYAVWIRPTSGSETNLVVFFNYGKGARGPFCSLQVNNKRVGRSHRIQFDYSLSPRVHAVIPLQELFLKFGLKLQDGIQMRAGILHRYSTERYDVSHWKQCAYKLRNHALELLNHLVASGTVIPGDTMAAALALVNSSLFENGTAPVRSAIKEDLIAHYKLYREIVAWQKTWRIKYRLDRLPLLAQVCWADRKRRLDRSDRLSLGLYREFIDSIENLSVVHRMVRALHPERYDRLHALAGGLESHVKGMNIYRASMESLRKQEARKKKRPSKVYLDALREYQQGLYYRFYLGKKRRWDQFGWLNYQLPKIRQYGKYRGDCGTVTAMQMAWYRGAGIAPLSLQQRPVPSHIVGHNFPAYYDPFRNRWISVQYPAYEDVPMYLYISLPVLHYQRYNFFYRKTGEQYRLAYYPGELGSTAKVRSALQNGFPHAMLQQLQWGQDTLTPGLLINRFTVPAGDADADRDQLLRDDELRLGLNPDNNDSDGDGRSDSWELEHGFDPRSASSPGALDAPAVDGILARSELNGAVTAPGFRGTKAVRDGGDIRIVYVKRFPQGVWIGAGLFNDIRKSSQQRYSVSLVLFGGRSGHREFWIQWINGRFYWYRVSRGAGRSSYQRLKQWNGRPLPACSGAAAKDVELLLAPELFHYADGAYLRLYSGGWNGKKWSNSTDSSGTVFLPLRDTAHAVPALSGSEAVTAGDQAGDAGNSAYDIKQVSWVLQGRFLAVELRFHRSVSGQPFAPVSVDFMHRRSRGQWIFRWFRPDWSKHYRYSGRSLEYNRQLNTGMMRCFPGSDKILLLIDRSLLPRGNGWQIRVRTGNVSADGKRTYSNDKTGYMDWR